MPQSGSVRDAHSCMNDSSLQVDARHCVRERVVRAFLIEEQKCVKQVRA